MGGPEMRWPFRIEEKAEFCSLTWDGFLQLKSVPGELREECLDPERDFG